MLEVCEEVVCTRLIQVVYKKMIIDSNGTALGTVEVFEFKVVVDAIVNFLTYINAELYQFFLRITSSIMFVACLE